MNRAYLILNSEIYFIPLINFYGKDLVAVIRETGIGGSSALIDSHNLGKLQNQQASYETKP